MQNVGMQEAEVVEGQLLQLVRGEGEEEEVQLVQLGYLALCLGGAALDRVVERHFQLHGL